MTNILASLGAINMDTAHVMIDGAVLLFTAMGAWNNMKMRQTVERLKWWIVRNFEAKKDAKFEDDSPVQRKVTGGVKGRYDSRASAFLSFLECASVIFTPPTIPLS